MMRNKNRETKNQGFTVEEEDTVLIFTRKGRNLGFNLPE
jgi:hypothetical protein